MFALSKLRMKSTNLGWYLVLVLLALLAPFGAGCASESTLNPTPQPTSTPAAQALQPTTSPGSDVKTEAKKDAAGSVQLWQGKVFMELDGERFLLGDTETIADPTTNDFSMSMTLPDGQSVEVTGNRNSLFVRTPGPSGLNEWIRFEAGRDLPPNASLILEGQEVIERTEELDGVTYQVSAQADGGVRFDDLILVSNTEVWSTTAGPARVVSQLLGQSDERKFALISVSENRGPTSARVRQAPGSSVPSEALMRLLRKSDSPVSFKSGPDLNSGFVGGGRLASLVHQGCDKEEIAKRAFGTLAGLGMAERGLKVMQIVNWGAAKISTGEMDRLIVGQTLIGGAGWISLAVTLPGIVDLLACLGEKQAEAAEQRDPPPPTLPPPLPQVPRYKPALTKGEPHLTTLDGVRYSFQAAGEFVQLRNDNFQMQSRFLGTVGSATWAQATAVRVGRHVIQTNFDASWASDESGIPVFIDGKPTRLGFEGIHFDDGGFAGRERGGVKDRTIVVVAPSGASSGSRT